MAVQQLLILSITLLSIVNAIHIVPYNSLSFDVTLFATGQWLRIDSLALVDSLQANYELGTSNAHRSCPLVIQLKESLGPGNPSTVVMFMRDSNGHPFNNFIAGVDLPPNTLITVHVSLLTTSWSVCVTTSACDSSNTFSYPISAEYPPSIITHLWFFSTIQGNVVIQKIATGY